MPPTWDNKADADAEAFDSEVDADGDLNASTASVHSGTNGYEVTFDDANAAFGVLNAAAIDQTLGTIECWVNPNAFGLAAGKFLVFAGAVDGAGALTWYLYLTVAAGTFSVTANVTNDAGGGDGVGSAFALTSGYHKVRMTFRRSTGAGNNDGATYVYVDDVLVASKTNSDNDAKDWDVGRFGMCFTDQAASFSGSFYMDDIQIANEVHHDPVYTGAVSSITGATTKSVSKILSGSVSSIIGTISSVTDIIRKIYAKVVGIVAPTMGLKGTIAPATDVSGDVSPDAATRLKGSTD